MKEQEKIDYQRIAEAIQYLQANFRRQPSLDEVAQQVHLSTFHFQRLFTEWAGVSPKKFLQYLSIGYAKSLLKAGGATLFDAALETGLSGTGRLHDLFINIEGMTPAEYKDGGRNLSIRYSFAETPFGNVLVASTHKGVCHLAFCDAEAPALEALKKRFPAAAFHQQVDAIQQDALMIFSRDWQNLRQVRLHLRGSGFQLKVWEALLKIPAGSLTTYGAIARQVNSAGASRAVGTAIGSNPVAFLIPCHRVIQSGGAFGGYMWGPVRKAAIIGWEAAQRQQEYPAALEQEAG